MKKITVSFVAGILFFGWFFALSQHKVFAVPDYTGEPFVLMATFTTDYSKSVAERKHNIELACGSLNKVFVEADEEFSFNKTVGERSEEKGYKSAKIIIDGKFAEGVGGGVCQVSTTLYNAALLSGLKVTEYHAHSLGVSYCSPSFDAMVNSNFADLKFVNNTGMPIYFITEADGVFLTVKIFGKKPRYTVERKSVVKEYIEIPEPETIVDENGDYPELYEGERKTLSWGKKGIVSEGFLVFKENGKVVCVKKIRKDRYSPIKGIVVEGTKKRGGEEISTEENLLKSKKT